MSLHDELQRIADRAPVADVSDDTWGRARRARRRERVLTVGAAAAVIALLVGLVAWLPGHLDPPVARTDGAAALPARLWTVQASDDVERADTLAVGPVAAAFLADLSDGQQVVAVGAHDGSYRVLDLPHVSGLGRPLALSPDGTRLAYGWTSETRASGSTPWGVRIVDLTDGAVRSVRPPGRGHRVTRLVWSPDGRWLVWSGDSGGEAAAGLVAPGSSTSTPLPPAPDPGRTREYAVGDDGTVAMLDPDRVSWWRAGAVRHHQPVDLPSTYSGPALVDGQQVLDLRLPAGPDASPGLFLHVDGRPDDLSGGMLPDFFRGSAPLGFDPARAAVVEVPATADANPSVWRAELTKDNGVVYDQLVTEENGPLTALTVAVDLPVEDDVDVPDWVATEGRSPWWWVGGAALLATAAYLALRWRRRG